LFHEHARAVARVRRGAGVRPERAYGTFDEIAKAERARENGIDIVSIVTPNHLHYATARAFLEVGVHVICDKPLTTTLGDAQALAELIAHAGKVFVLTHNYTGYPMVRQARVMIEAREVGANRLVRVEHAQGWFAARLETAGRDACGARGSLWASQVAPGNDNAPGRPGLGAGRPELPAAHAARGATVPGPARRQGNGSRCRVPPSSRSAIPKAAWRASPASTAMPRSIRATLEGHAPDGTSLLAPTVLDGVKGVRFIDAAVESSHRGGTWVKFRV
jgi:hypothetical protein